MPFVLGVSYRDRKPADDEHCPVRLTTRLAKSQVKAGETVALSAEVINTADEGQPTTIVVLGLPAGLEPRSGQLEELKKSGAIDCCETRAGEVICCWRALAARKKIAVELELVASVPGRYTGPPSQTYLLDAAEQKRWSNPLEVEITRD
jgi:alpha-2-macroglobulin-like protein